MSSTPAPHASSPPDYVLDTTVRPEQKTDTGLTIPDSGTDATEIHANSSPHCLQLLDDAEIRILLTESDATDDWPLRRMKDNKLKDFKFWMNVLGIIDKEIGMTYQYNIPIIIHNLHLPCPGNISSFVRRIKNVEKKFLKSGNDSLVTQLAFSDETGERYTDIGPACKSIGITDSWLKSPHSINNITLTREVVLELNTYKKIHNITDIQYAAWIQNLSREENVLHSGTVRINLQRIYTKHRLLVKTYKPDSDEVNNYLKGTYRPSDSFNKQLDPENKNTPMNENEQHTSKQAETKSNSEKVSMLKTERRELHFELYKMRSENFKLHKQLNEYKQRLSILSLRNVNKRIKRRDVQITKLRGEHVKTSKNLRILQQKITEVKSKYKTQTNVLKYYKQKRRFDVQNKNASRQNNSSTTINTNKFQTMANETASLKDHVNFLENENEELNERINMLMATKQVSTFHNGKYTSDIRELYAALLSMNVGVTNVEKVIRTVLTKLADVNVERLPKKTFAETMLIEAKALAQLQAAEAIFSTDNLTLHTDGTKRDGREYGGLQIGTNSGQYSLGISEIVRGDTESFFNLIKEIFTDITSLVDKDQAHSKANEIILKVKNMMTDRHVVNSSLKERLEQWKNDCLPLIIDNFNSFSDPVKQKIIEINHFKCNLHVLVNLGSQAEIALKEWEKSVIFSETPEPEHNFSTTASDFIRATTKLCVPGADEKSGYGFLFNTFLQGLIPNEKLHISSFRGHRINILFSMAAGVFHHRAHITEFINSYFTDKQNRLVSSVASYLGNNVYLAGCRALGIIDKIFTGPLWRQIEAAPHILDLNDMWYTFLNNLEIFSKDASELLAGNPVFPEFTVKDVVYESLFNVDNDELDVLTLEALRILCTNFMIIIHRQLGDCLPGGKFHVGTAKDFPELREQSLSVSSTNIISERDFANLDRLRREKPNANTIALEGMILFTNNKTIKWIDEMNVEKRDKMIEIARKCAPEMIANFKKKKTELRKKHYDLLQKKKEEILRLDRQKVSEILKISKEIEKHGGLWSSESDVIKFLQTMTTSEQMDAVKCQLKYHKIVLKSNPADKTLLQFSANSVSFSLNKLIENLKLVITHANQTAVSTDNSAHSKSATGLQIRTKEEREIFMATHRETILKKIEETKRKQTMCTVRAPKQRKLDHSALNNSPHTFANNDSAGQSVQQDTNENRIDTVVHTFKLNQTVAVAYSDSWYPGNVINIDNENAHIAAVQFLHPCNSACDAFRWPNKDDISNVENIFVFASEFEILPKDSSGRVWKLDAINDIKRKYETYKITYF